MNDGKWTNEARVKLAGGFVIKNMAFITWLVVVLKKLVV
jgi:hypothetical protein